LGAIGLILPLALGILPIFTPVAAVGLAVIIAAVHHLKYKKNKAIDFNAVLFLLAAFMAYGRFTIL